MRTRIIVKPEIREKEIKIPQMIEKTLSDRNIGIKFL